jgi:asparagine synthase (glutamine-hydrolysing)
LLRGISGAVDLSDFGSDPDPWISAVARSFQSDPDQTERKYTFSSAPQGGIASVLIEAGLAIIADAELHNRTDLLSQLSSRDLSSSCSDATLILAAYEKWGEKSPEFLLGEFSFAIWDSRRERLFCCRDHMGNRPFYYWTSGTRFAFSSDLRCLFSLPGIGRELNRAKVGVWAQPAGIARDVHHEETFYKGIFSVPSATSLTFKHGRLTKHEFWQPQGVSVHMPPKEEEAFEALRDLLFSAVECRVRGKTRVAAFLSGGLDSSALVAIAARCLEKSNRGVLALAAVLPDESRSQFQDEREFIDELRSLPNVTIEYVAPESGGPFDGIEDASSFPVDPLRYSRQYLFDAMQDAAARGGADAILAGMWGETGPTTWGRGYYLELAAGFHWYTLARELPRLRAVRHISPVRALGGEVLDFLSPHRGFKPLFLLAPDFLRTVEASSPRKFHWPDHRREQATHIRWRMSTHAVRPIAPLTRVPMTLPFLDKRVLEFCLAAPGNLKVRDGYQRHLIRRALEGVLPPKIQWRTSKSPFAPDYTKRYAAQVGKARDFVAAIRRNDPVRSIVDVDRLRCLLDQPDTPSGKAAALAIVPSTIYLICFLRQFAEFRP